MSFLSLNAIHYLLATTSSFIQCEEKNRELFHLTETCRYLITPILSTERHQLAFNTRANQLIWMNGRSIRNTITLDNAEHYEIVRWIEINAIESGIKPALKFDITSEKIISTVKMRAPILAREIQVLGLTA